MEEELVKQIIMENAVTFEIIEKHFKGKHFKFIRDWLEKHNIDRHLSIINISINQELYKFNKKIMTKDLK